MAEKKGISTTKLAAALAGMIAGGGAATTKAQEDPAAGLQFNVVTNQWEDPAGNPVPAPGVGTPTPPASEPIEPAPVETEEPGPRVGKLGKTTRHKIKDAQGKEAIVDVTRVEGERKRANMELLGKPLEGEQINMQPTAPQGYSLEPNYLHGEPHTIIRDDKAGMTAALYDTGTFITYDNGNPVTQVWINTEHGEQYYAVGTADGERRLFNKDEQLVGLKEPGRDGNKYKVGEIQCKEGEEFCAELNEDGTMTLKKRSIREALEARALADEADKEAKAAEAKAEKSGAEGDEVRAAEARTKANEAWDVANDLGEEINTVPAAKIFENNMSLLGGLRLTLQGQADREALEPKDAMPSRALADAFDGDNVEDLSTKEIVSKVNTIRNIDAGDVRAFLRREGVDNERIDTVIDGFEPRTATEEKDDGKEKKSSTIVEIELGAQTQHDFDGDFRGTLAGMLTLNVVNPGRTSIEAIPGLEFDLLEDDLTLEISLPIAVRFPDEVDVSLGPKIGGTYRLPENFAVEAAVGLGIEPGADWKKVATVDAEAGVKYRLELDREAMLEVGLEAFLTAFTQDQPVELIGGVAGVVGLRFDVGEPAAVAQETDRMSNKAKRVEQDKADAYTDAIRQGLEQAIKDERAMKKAPDAPRFIKTPKEKKGPTTAVEINEAAEGTNAQIDKALGAANRLLDAVEAQHQQRQQGQQQPNGAVNPAESAESSAPPLPSREVK